MRVPPPTTRSRLHRLCLLCNLLLRPTYPLSSSNVAVPYIVWHICTRTAGPWSEPRLVLSHHFTNNTLYNPAVHGVVQEQQQQQDTEREDRASAHAPVAYLLWSGSLSQGYTSVSTTHHDASVTVPRYDYNVIMHRLSLQALAE